MFRVVLLKKLTMITTSILLNILGFYIFYATSKKTIYLPKLGFENKVQDHTLIAKSIALIVLSISLYLNTHSLGIVSGTLTFFIFLMTFGSLIILTAPLGLVNYYTLIISILLLAILEFSILQYAS